MHMAANTKKLLFPLCSADLQVAIKCKSGADETYETKALGPLDDTGVFRIPLAAELLRDDGSLLRAAPQLDRHAVRRSGAAQDHQPIRRRRQQQHDLLRGRDR